MQNISNVLKINGIVFVEIPNRDCIYYKIFRRKDFEKYDSLSYINSLNIGKLSINKIKVCAYPLTLMIEEKKFRVIKKISPFFMIEWKKRKQEVNKFN